MSYYDVLGIPANASRESIRKAFRKLARRYHPDAGEGSSPERFRQVQEAYEALSDPTNRRRYDLELGRARTSQTAHAEPIVPVEPMISREPFVPRMPFAEATYLRNTRQPDLDDLLEEMFQSLDEFFRPPFSRW